MWRSKVGAKAVFFPAVRAPARVCVCVCVCVCAHACAISTSPAFMISCHLSPTTPPSPHLPPPLPPTQRKPAIQSGAEIKSLGVWPGPRPLANEVRERQPKSLPLGLYCLYRGLVIGGYGSGIKRLLPQPLRRVRRSLPPPLLPLPHLSVLFERKRIKGRPSHWVHSWRSLSLIPSSLCLPPSVSARLPARYRVCV